MKRPDPVRARHGGRDAWLFAAMHDDGRRWAVWYVVTPGGPPPLGVVGFVRRDAHGALYVVEDLAGATPVRTATLEAAAAVAAAFLGPDGRWSAELVAATPRAAAGEGA